MAAPQGRGAGLPRPCAGAAGGNVLMSDEPSDLDRQIGAALRQARLSRACTQAELAEHLAVGRSALAHYEAGNRPLTVSMLICAARALQYPASQLLPALPG